MSIIYCGCACMIDTDEDPDGAEGTCEVCRQLTADDERALMLDLELADMKAGGLL